jgi:hypothetical protein
MGSFLAEYFQLSHNNQVYFLPVYEMWIEAILMWARDDTYSGNKHH